MGVFEKHCDVFRLELSEYRVMHRARRADACNHGGQFAQSMHVWNTSILLVRCTEAAFVIRSARITGPAQRNISSNVLSELRI